jgi:adenine-specific DNA-methyltransferase
MVHEAPDSIKELVEDFEENEYQYKNSSVFDEENTKVKFLNPFFEALGWDLRNNNQYAPQFQEVEFEDSIKVGSSVKSPDYSFKIGGQRIFFVEAKKPSVDIEEDKEPALQVRRYGWTVGLPLCILTDFETLAVYDTTIKPNKHQSASIARVKLYHYSQYVEKWDEIYNIFSKEAILKGKFDKFAKGISKIEKSGTSQFDKEFLDEINGWRKLLAKNIASNNKELLISRSENKEQEEKIVNYAVQVIIDRIIFLRMAEGRGIEKNKTLFNTLDKENVYQELCDLFKKADLKYNSGLFHFEDSDGSPEFVDTITPQLNIDNKVFKQIFKYLYYPDSPYEFSVISSEVLGNIYEQFLGSEIKLNKANQAKVETKPEVRKAGGVYYTPQFIVKYIIENTLGRILKNKTPNKVSDLKIIDPACGSGSFLLGAYQYLLNWHLNYYMKMTQRPKNVIYQVKNGSYRLTIQEKKRILTNNIYGVDIDSQAVEVTKLSLLLKVLEDENKDIIEQQQKLFQERALPNLSNNIKCGNSLVNMSMIEDDQLSIDEIIKLNPFNWNEEFEDIFDNGGFDLVVGNPPYVKETTNKNAFEGVKKSPYYQGKMDLWYLFGCKALDIVKPNGVVSFIAINNWVTASGASKFRNKVNEEAKFEKIVDFGNYKVFKGPSIQTMVYIMSKNSTKKTYHFEYSKLLNDKVDENVVINFLETGKDQENFNSFNAAYNREDNKNSYLTFVEDYKAEILNKIQDINGIVFFDKKEISQGIVMPQDFLNKKNAKILKLPVGTGVFRLSNQELKNLNLNENEYELIKPYYTSNELNRYSVNSNNEYWIIYTKSDINKKIKDYPNIKKHLNRFKKIITSENKPYGLSRARKENIFKDEKIIVTRKCLQPTFTYVDFDSYVSQTFNVIKTERFNLKYLTGLLNSKLIAFWLKYKGKIQGNNYQLDKEPLLKIPIINPDKETENRVEEYVDKLINLNSKLLNNVHINNEGKIFEKHIESIEKKLNQEIYKLYGLSDDEIKIIEEDLD